MPKKKEAIEVTVAEVVDFLRINGEFANALQEVVARKVTVEAARREGIKATARELQGMADSFRIERGLLKADDTEQWLRSIGISVEIYEEHLKTSLLVEKYKDRLEKKADKHKYLSSPEIKERIRERLFLDWLDARLA